MECVTSSTPIVVSSMAAPASQKPQRPEVFFVISQGGRPIGKIIFELYSDIVPRTCENFRCLCTGERGQGVSGTKLHYKGSKLHRIVRGFMVQGGDITMGNGMGGESIYGETFPDEELAHEYGHTKAGVLSMANAGPDSNGSQFFITLAPAPHLDGSHVVFGQVVEGMEVLMGVADTPCNVSDEPLRLMLVADCGQLHPKDSEEGVARAKSEGSVKVDEAEAKVNEDSAKVDEAAAPS